MWTRVQLKDKAKWAMKRNYWKVVLISFIAVLISGTGGSSIGSGSGNFATNQTESITQIERYDEDMNQVDDDVEAWLNDLEDGDSSYVGIHSMNSGVWMSIIAWVMIALIIFLIIFALAIVLTAFVLNPLMVGARRFFYVNLNHQAQVREIGFGFDHNYKNIVKVMFLRDLYTFLWSLLFLIPGIVKAYEYRMMPYLLAEYPDMTSEQAFETSKRMMNGQKWKAFVLDLSFIGWNILSVMTIGVLDLFYVGPYKNMTNAALYEVLKYGGNQPQFGGPQMNGANPYMAGSQMNEQNAGMNNTQMNQ